MSNEKIETPKSNSKTRIYLFVLLVGVALTAWSVFFKDKNNLSDQELIKDESAMEEDNKDNEMQGHDSGIVSGVTGSYLEGRLENSDDVVQGNYKLVSSSSQIYIKTGRDFSSYVGSDVLVLIDGTMESFTLLDIEKRVEKDGYIQSQ